VVMSAVKRRGTLFLLVVLPHGSRSLIPAGWTDWAGTGDDGSLSRCEHHDSCLASLADLLHARGIVDALLGRCLIPQQTPAADEESCDATDPGPSRTTHADAITAEPRTARRRSTIGCLRLISRLTGLGDETCQNLERLRATGVMGAQLASAVP
jgi:hypothetical protein